MTFRRLLNLGKLVLSYFMSVILKKPVYWGMPFSIAIEPVAFCNLQCKECPTGKQNLQRETGTMEFDVFKKIIDDLPPEVFYLTLYFQGEPYLNKHFFEMAAYACSRRLYVSSSTNGHFLDINSARNTINSGVHRLIVSLDGTDVESYSSYRTGGDFNKVTEGILTLSEQKKQLKSLHPYLIAQCIVLRTNEHLLGKFQSLSKKLGADAVSIKTAQFYDLTDSNPLIPSLENYSRYSRDSQGMYHIKNPLHNHCFRMWSGAVITWDGQLLPCCYDKDASYTYGNLNREPFRRLWKNEKASAFRKAVFSHRKAIDICRNCTE
jgi:radical SAM protein with 4Fe4S-binding SPASM domain